MQRHWCASVCVLTVAIAAGGVLFATGDLAAQTPSPGQPRDPVAC